MQTLQERISQHKYNSITKKDNYIFHKAIRKYGFENFKWEIIDTANTKQELEEKEIKAMHNNRLDLCNDLEKRAFLQSSYDICSFCVYRSTISFLSHY